jgi:hypothetical protein
MSPAVGEQWRDRHNQLSNESSIGLGGPLVEHWSGRGRGVGEWWNADSVAKHQRHSQQGVVSQIGYLGRQDHKDLDGLLPAMIDKAISLR